MATDTGTRVASRFRRASSLAAGRSNLLELFEAFVEPLALAVSLWLVGYYFEGELLPQYMILSVVVFALTFPGSVRLEESIWRAIRDIVLGWSILAFLLLLLGYATRYYRIFPKDVVLAILWVAPVSQIAAHLLVRLMAPVLSDVDGISRPTVIVGMNDQGIALARRLANSRYGSMRLLGFFDDRDIERLGDSDSFPLLGRTSGLAQFIKTHHVHTIYLSLPMASQPRILELLDDLRDTTASIYFVPDFFVTDLIQGRIDMVCGMPVVAVCETPFRGGDGLVKRASDIVLAALIVLLISPLLIAIALGVKLTSPGPVIFKQRRYGLDGAEILVYKFRSMTVCEDGDTIRQARQGDSRITPFGAFLRRTSLDELPQFINVLQGRMSVVGPRPHAVAHNEQYRGVIKGYMVRHKVRPGITGWAQINGYRGETDTVAKMQSRVEYDLDYLRNWSLRLDLYIILKTALIVFRGQSGAY
jgi:putative colanic acid biosynthesis UDP-glucose lipid carrier transferase